MELEVLKLQISIDKVNILLVASTAYHGLFLRALRILGQKQTVEFDIAPYYTVHIDKFSTFLAWSGVELEVLKLQISTEASSLHCLPWLPHTRPQNPWPKTDSRI